MTSELTSPSYRYPNPKTHTVILGLDPGISKRQRKSFNTPFYSPSKNKQFKIKQINKIKPIKTIN
jgi:hypothetical protein